MLTFAQTNSKGIRRNEQHQLHNGARTPNLIIARGTEAFAKTTPVQTSSSRAQVTRERETQVMKPGPSASTTAKSESKKTCDSKDVLGAILLME